MLFICLPALPSFKITFIFKAHSCDSLCEAILNLSITELSLCVLIVLFIPFISLIRKPASCYGCVSLPLWGSFLLRLDHGSSQTGIGGGLGAGRSS